MEPKHEDHKTDSRSKDIERPSDTTFVKQQLRRINWVVCLSFLVLVVTLYQAYLSRQSNKITRDALTENKKQFSDTLQEMREQTIVAKNATEAAQEAATAASGSAAAAGRQVSATEEQTNTAIDALRLDQRAWLGYERYTIEARANDTSRWEKREPKTGEQFRGRLYIQNIGKTPALNVRFMSAPPILIPAGGIPSQPEEEKWSIAGGEFVVFPNDDGLSQNTRPRNMPSQVFPAYSNRAREIFFWARLYYCDTTGRRHWTQIGVAHLFEAGTFSIRSSSVSPDPGEADHPDCQY